MSAGHPTVSVVTPFYNSAATLDECIASVRAQRFGDFEYLLVDNHSTDGSAEIAARHAAADPRIRVHRNAEFVAQVPNYNGALALVDGGSRFVKIVQADDLLLPSCLEEMVAVGDRDPGIGLISSFYLKGDAPAGTGVPFGTSVMEGRDLVRRMLLTGCHPIGSPTSVMYRADLVRARRPFFAEGRFHEDTEAAYELLLEARVGFVHQILSYLRTDSGSTMGRILRFNGGILDHLVMLERFGPLVLEPGELAEARRREWTAYYGYLGSARLGGRGEEFWAFHRQGLAQIDRDLDDRAVRSYALRVAASLALNPLDTARGRWKAIRSQRGR